MFLWFVIVAPVIVAEVFRSPMADYRVVALGAALPLAEVVFGGPRVLHTLLGSVACLGLVMAATVGRRLVRRRWLGIPIGMMLHLALAGTWADDSLMWWPAFGWDFPDGGLPEWNRPLWFGLLLEVLAIGLGVWAYRRYRLDQPENRELLVSAGHLDRAVVS